MPKATQLEGVELGLEPRQLFLTTSSSSIFPEASCTFLVQGKLEVRRLKKEVVIATNWTPFHVIRSQVCSSFARGDACLETLLNTCPWREPSAPELFRESLDT